MSFRRLLPAHASRPSQQDGSLASLHGRAGNSSSELKAARMYVHICIKRTNGRALHFLTMIRSQGILITPKITNDLTISANLLNTHTIGPTTRSFGIVHPLQRSQRAHRSQ